MSKIPEPSDQQYSTPDGSIWTEWYDPITGRLEFHRIAGKGYEDDFRPQKLGEVLRSWGPLSLHDPLNVQREALRRVLVDLGWDARDDIDDHVQQVVDGLAVRGWKIAQQDGDGE